MVIDGSTESCSIAPLCDTDIAIGGDDMDDSDRDCVGLLVSAHQSASFINRTRSNDASEKDKPNLFRVYASIWKYAAPCEQVSLFPEVAKKQSFGKFIGDGLITSVCTHVSGLVSSNSSVVLLR